MDLCIDARMAFFSGIGVYIRKLTPYLAKTFQTTLLVSEEGQSWCEGIDQILFKAPIYSLEEQLNYSKVIPKCQLFFSPHYNVPLSKTRANQHIVTIHDTCHLVFGSFLQKLYAKIVMKKALKADQIITVSEFSKKEIERFFGPKNICVLSSGVDQSFFQPKPFSKKVQEKYQLPSKYALFIGTQKPHKNLLTLVKAFSKVDLPLVCLGKDLKAVEEEDLPFVYSMADLFIFPSLYEGFGLPPLEAMCCGCPTAVAHAASIPEVCKDASIYFDPKDEKSILKSVEKTLSAKKELVQKGYQRVQSFAWDKVAEEHIKVFQGLIHA